MRDTSALNDFWHPLLCRERTDKICSMGAAVVAMAMAQERRVVDAFERGGVTSPERARPLSDLGIEPRGFGWRMLVRQAIVRETSPGLYYLDLESWRASIATRRRRALILVIVVAVIAAWFMLRGS